MKTPLTVANIPVERLWRESEWIEASRERFLTTEETKVMVRDETISIALASINAPMLWLPYNKRFEYWKAISPMLIDGTRDKWITGLDQFYAASIWRSGTEDFLLFEHHH